MPVNVPRSAVVIALVLGACGTEGISVSKDGRYVLYSQIDETASDLMLVDGVS